jgi:hypothetical protein
MKVSYSFEEERKHCCSIILKPINNNKERNVDYNSIDMVKAILESSGYHVSAVVDRYDNNSKIELGNLLTSNNNSTTSQSKLSFRVDLHFSEEVLKIYFDKNITSKFEVNFNDTLSIRVPHFLASSIKNKLKSSTTEYGEDKKDIDKEKVRNAKVKKTQRRPAPIIRNKENYYSWNEKGI